MNLFNISLTRKIFYSFSILLLALLTNFSTVNAASNDEISVCVDGIVLNFSEYGQAPVMDNGRVLVPFRQIFESLGYKVTYDITDKSAVLSKDTSSIKVWEGKSEFLIDETQTQQLDVPAKTTASGRFVLPVRAVGEALGLEVTWDNNYQTVFIFSTKDDQTTRDELIDKAKLQIKPKQYDYDYAFYEIRKDGKIGYIDKTGKIVFDPDADTLHGQLSYGLSIQYDKDTGLYGYTDRKGNYVLPPKYEKAQPFSDGVAIVAFPQDEAVTTQENVLNIPFPGHYKLIDTTGRILYSFKYTHLPLEYHDGISRVVLQDEEVKISDNLGTYRYNYIDKKGNLLFPTSVKSTRDFSDGLGIFSTEVNGSAETGVVDTTGKVVLPLGTRIEAPYSEGLALASVSYGTPDLKYGFIDKKGNWAIPPIYDYAQDFFSEDLVAVHIKDGTKLGKWSFINHYGETSLALPYGYTPKYGYGCKGFIDGVALLHKWGSTFIDGCVYIDKTGKIITDELYGSDSYDSENGLIKVYYSKFSDPSLEHAFRYMDTKGNVVYTNEGY